LLCRRSASELTQIEPVLTSLGVELVAIGSGTAAMAADFKQDFNFAGQIYVDPERLVYEDLRCKRGWKNALFNSNTLKSIVSSWDKGYRQGKKQGDML
jgi:hypothetical protein